jgi:hypothetical protein
MLPLYIGLGGGCVALAYQVIRAQRFERRQRAVEEQRRNEAAVLAMVLRVQGWRT